MEEKQKFIFDALMSLPNFKNFEFQRENGKVTLRGFKRGFLKTEETVVEISKPQTKPSDLAKVSAKFNDKVVTDTIEKHFLYIMLREVSVINQEHFVQIIIELNAEGNRVVNFSDFAIHAFYTHIYKSFPNLKYSIKIQALGDRNEELAFVIEKGLQDEDFQNFFEYGIKLKSALKTCRNNKIEKLVFFDTPKNTYEDFTIEQLEEMTTR